jgi:hypothetical protein
MRSVHLTPHLIDLFISAGSQFSRAPLNQSPSSTIGAAAASLAETRRQQANPGARGARRHRARRTRARGVQSQGAVPGPGRLGTVPAPPLPGALLPEACLEECQ